MISPIKRYQSRDVLPAYDGQLSRAWKELHRLALLDSGWIVAPHETLKDLALLTVDDEFKTDEGLSMTNLDAER